MAAVTASSNSLPSLLSTLTSSLTACTTATTPSTSIFDPSSSTATAKDGISLLTTKNEILLSYLQNLVFLIVLKLRGLREDEEQQEGGNSEEVIQKLGELRAYMEKGVKPLEGKLKYQIEKVVKAAELEVERKRTDKGEKKKKKKKKKKKGANTRKGRKEEDGDGSSHEEDDGDASATSDEDEDEDQEELDELSYRPNPSALLKQPTAAADKSRPSSNPTSSSTTTTQTYKPPRINPVSMPHDPSSTTNDFNDTRTRRSRPPPKSALLDDYITHELSSAPQSQPSIGSSLSQSTSTHGRGQQLSHRERKQELERRRYEEENFVRLPGPSKKERKKSRAAAGGDRDRSMGFGGEEFAGLGEMGERVSRAVGRKDAPREGVLGRSRKRERDGDGVGGGGGGGRKIGEGFEKRRRVVEERKRRKGGPRS